MLFAYTGSITNANGFKVCMLNISIYGRAILVRHKFKSDSILKNK